METKQVSAEQLDRLRSLVDGRINYLVKVDREALAALLEELAK